MIDEDGGTALVSGLVDCCISASIRFGDWFAGSSPLQHAQARAIGDQRLDWLQNMAIPGILKVSAVFLGEINIFEGGSCLDVFWPDAWASLLSCPKGGYLYLSRDDVCIFVPP